MLKKISACILLFLPTIALAEGKRTFFPASSFYFWVLIAVIFYLFYLFRTSKFPLTFLKSPFARTAIISVSLLILAFFSINHFISDPEAKKVEVFAEPTIKQRLNLDHQNAVKAEEEYTNVDNHIKYIDQHFEIPYRWAGSYEDELRDDFTIYNFYSFRLDQTDSFYLNITRFAIALFNIKQNKYDQAKLFLEDITDPKFPYLDYHLAIVNSYLNKDDLAVKYFKQAILIKNRYTEASYQKLISILENKGNDKELILLLKQQDGKKYIADKTAIRLYFLDNDISSYYSLVVKHAFRNFKWTGFVAALVIMLVWLFYIVRIDLFEKEGYFPIIIVLFTGMVSSLLCFYFYDLLHFKFDYSLRGGALHKLMYSIFTIGLIEETVKILPLLLLLLFKPKIVNEAYDYVLYACISALGFAFMENLLYFDGDLEGIIHGRAMTSVPGHMMDSSILAYGFVLSRFRYKNFPLYFSFPIFLFLACISHGLYDYWLFINANFIFWFHFLVSASIWLIIINNCINNSPVFSYSIKFQTRNVQLYMAFSLIGILIMEYAFIAWEKGPTYANLTFNSTLFFGGIFIVYYVDKLTNMDLVRGYWNTINFTTIEDKRQGDVFDLKSFLLRLVSGDLISHSFVNVKILVQCHPDNHELLKHFQTTIRAVITDRLIVKCLAKRDKKEYSDPYWFQIKTEHPINVGGYTGQDFIFRFEESRPSFRKSETLYIYLYCFKNYPGEIISREDIRALGKVMIKMQ